MPTYKFVNDGKDPLGAIVGQYQQPEQQRPLLGGRFQSAEQLVAAYEELERRDTELDEQLRNANLNEIFWSGSR